jgi:hypothetical protein
MGDQRKPACHVIVDDIVLGAATPARRGGCGEAGIRSALRAPSPPPAGLPPATSPLQGEVKLAPPAPER